MQRSAEGRVGASRAGPEKQSRDSRGAEAKAKHSERSSRMPEANPNCAATRREKHSGIEADTSRPIRFVCSDTQMAASAPVLPFDADSFLALIRRAWSNQRAACADLFDARNRLDGERFARAIMAAHTPLLNELRLILPRIHIEEQRSMEPDQQAQWIMLPLNGAEAVSSRDPSDACLSVARRDADGSVDTACVLHLSSDAAIVLRNGSGRICLSWAAGSIAMSCEAFVSWLQSEPARDERWSMVSALMLHLLEPELALAAHAAKSNSKAIKSS